MLDGRSLSRNESCRLKGEALLSELKPRKEPCRSSMVGVACGRWMANGLCTCLAPAAAADAAGGGSAKSGSMDVGCGGGDKGTNGSTNGSSERGWTKHKSEEKTKTKREERKRSKTHQKWYY